MFGLTERRNTADPMYRIPRPRTRAECLEEARPCPWAGCRHHLLIEVMSKRGDSKRSPSARKTSLGLNRAAKGRTGGGRRKGLRSSAAELLVRAWIDDAIEHLMRMPYTCALDVAARFPDGLSQREVGWVLGISEQAVHAEETKPQVREAYEHMRQYIRDAQDEDDHEE